MCSYTLNLMNPAPEPLPHKPSHRVMPTHTAFSSDRDVLALLWESGYVEIYDLHTRIGVGRGKVMEPEKLWTGNIGHEINTDSIRSYTQIVVLRIHGTTDTDSRKGEVRIAVLAADIASATPDVVCVATIRPDHPTDAFEAGLPSRSGRLLSSDEHVIWQAPLGDVFESAFLSCQLYLSYTDKRASPPRPAEPRPERNVLLP